MHPRLISMATQALLLLMSVLVPLVLPATMGLAFYGEFVKASAATFLLIKLFETPMEGAQRYVDDRAMLKSIAALALLAFTCGVIWNVLDARRPVHLPLLASGLVSMVMLIFVGARRSPAELLAYVATFVLIYLGVFAAMLARLVTPVLGLSIANAMALIWLPRVLRTARNRPASSVASPTVPSAVMPQRGFASVLWGIATGAFPAFVQLGVPTLQAAHAAPSALGEVRLAASVLGMASLVLPVPLKALAPALAERGAAFDRQRHFLAMALALSALAAGVGVGFALHRHHPRAALGLLLPLGALVMLYLTCERGLIAFSDSRRHALTSVAAALGSAATAMMARPLPLVLQFIAAAAAGICVFLLASRPRLVAADNRWGTLLASGIAGSMLLLASAVALGWWIVANR